MIKDYNLKKATLLNQQDYKCYHCNKPFEDQNEVQLAHRLIKSKANIKLLGLNIVDNVLNLRATHGGACNDAVIINRATQPIKAQELIDEIKDCLNSQL